MLKFALVGCGAIAARYADLLKHRINAATLVGVSDASKMQRDEFSAKHGVPAYKDVSEMLAQTKPDVVCVLTPSGSHAEQALKLADQNVHVIVEKPMALTITDAEKLVQKFSSSTKKLFVVKQNRFNVAVQRIKAALDQNLFGSIFLGSVRVRWCRTQEYYDQAQWRGTYSQDGGVIANQASHHLDMLNWWFGPVESVQAHGRRYLAKIEAEDTAVVVIKFVNGATGLVEATTATRPSDSEGSISILGEHGNTEIGGFSMDVLKSCHFASLKNHVLEGNELNIQNPWGPGYGHFAFLNHVIDCIEHGHAPLVEPVQELESVRLIAAIYESMACDGAEVKLKEFQQNKSLLGICEA